MHKMYVSRNPVNDKPAVYWGEEDNCTRISNHSNMLSAYLSCNWWKLKLWWRRVD